MVRTKGIKVLIADSHPVVREGLRSAILKEGGGIKVVGEASNGSEVLKIARDKKIDVFVLDIMMLVHNGIETASRLLDIIPEAKSIILSIYDNRMYVERALKAGAKGYILKESPTKEIIRAIREVHNGHYFLSPVVAKFFINGYIKKAGGRISGPSIVDLSKREKEVLQMVAEGMTSREIASTLSLSPNTVFVHKKNIRRKLDIHKQADLVRLAIKEGICKL